jgi:hypothetical protein
LAALQMLRICLFGRPKRRKQPERYAQCRLKLVGKLWNKKFIGEYIDKIKLKQYY